MGASAPVNYTSKLYTLAANATDTWVAAMHRQYFFIKCVSGANNIDIKFGSDAGATDVLTLTTAAGSNIYEPLQAPVCSFTVKAGASGATYLVISDYNSKT